MHKAFKYANVSFNDQRQEVNQLGLAWHPFVSFHIQHTNWCTYGNNVRRFFIDTIIIQSGCWWIVSHFQSYSIQKRIFSVFQNSSYLYSLLLIQLFPFGNSQNILTTRHKKICYKKLHLFLLVDTCCHWSELERNPFFSARTHQIAMVFFCPESFHEWFVCEKSGYFRVYVNRLHFFVVFFISVLLQRLLRFVFFSNRIKISSSLLTITLSYCNINLVLE